MHRYNIEPLEIAISERLYSHLTNLSSQLHQRGESLLPSISWVRFGGSSKAANYGWALHLVSARVLPTHDRFQCGTVTLHIGNENRDALRGKLIDRAGGKLRITDSNQSDT